MTPSQAVATNAKYFVHKQNLNIGDFEITLGMSRGYLGRVAHGEKSLSVDKCMKISELLNVPITSLLDVNVCKRIRIEELRAELQQLESELKDV